MSKVGYKNSCLLDEIIPKSDLPFEDRVVSGLVMVMLSIVLMVESMLEDGEDGEEKFSFTAGSLGRAFVVRMMGCEISHGPAF